MYLISNTNEIRWKNVVWARRERWKKGDESGDKESWENRRKSGEKMILYVIHRDVPVLQEEKERPRGRGGFEKLGREASLEMKI